MANEEQLQTAKVLIDQGQVKEARKILLAIQEQPEAQHWLTLLDNEQQGPLLFPRRLFQRLMLNLGEDIRVQLADIWGGYHNLLTIIAIIITGIFAIIFLYLNHSDQEAVA